MSQNTNWLALDTFHREQAIDPQGSFIVEAPAGAGKTELLTQRFLALLAHVEHPEEIVALTFTKKAAAEMRDRIVRSLAMGADDTPPEEPHRQVTHALARKARQRDTERGWSLMEHPGRLQVTTLDALCGQLARQMPLLSRLGQQPSVAVDPTPHYEQAARETLRGLDGDHPGSECVSRVLDRFDNDRARLQRLLEDMLARRDQWLRHARTGVDLGQAEEALREMVSAELQAIAEQWTIERQTTVMPAARYAASQVLLAQAAGEGKARWHPVAALDGWTTPLGSDPADLPRWRALALLLLTEKAEPRTRLPSELGFSSDEGKQLQKSLKPWFDAFRNDGSGVLLARLLLLPDPVYTDDDRSLMEDLMVLLKIATAQLWLSFRQAGEVDFTEIAQNALLALGRLDDPSDLQLQLDYRIRHLLVDEFQDTSPTQVELLERLTAGWQRGDGRTLFLVGDPMQSIYKFRKADVGLFLKVREQGLGALPLTPLHLYRNNRSHPLVVDWVNRVFPRVMGERDDHHQGAVRFTPAAPTRGDHPLAAVCWHPHVLRGPDADDTDASSTEVTDHGEAERVVYIIRACREQDSAGTVAVLVRARSHLHELVATLRSQSPALPFQAVEIESLKDRQIVQDLHSLTHALYHLADRVHWLAILRAPWCGLTLHDLHALAGHDHQRPVWTLMHDEATVQRLSEDGQRRLGHVRQVLDEALAHQGRQRPRRWVEGTWQTLGGPWCASTPDDLADAQAYLDLLDRCERHGMLDLPRLARELDRLFAAPQTAAEGAVQLMTIHKSKGLEFDTVIVPGLHHKAPAADRPLLLWDEVLDDAGHERLVVAPPPARSTALGAAADKYHYLHRFEGLRAVHESRRLLYVAVTRARRQLHLLASAAADVNNALKAPPKSSLLALLWDEAEPLFLAHSEARQPADAFATPPEAARSIPPSYADYAHQLVRLKQPVIPEDLRGPDHAPTAPSGDTDGPIPNGADRSALDPLPADVGTLVHRYLELIAQEGTQVWSADRGQALKPAMQRWLEQRGHAAGAAQRGADQVWQHLVTTLNSEAGQWVLAPHPEAMSEWALSSQTADGLRSHVIDRTFVADGVRWIIDYKTTADDRASPTAYEEQLRRYSTAFGPEHPLKMAIFFTARGILEALNAADQG